MQDVDPVIDAFDRLVARDGARIIIATAGIRVSATALDCLSRAASRTLADARLMRGSPVGLLGSNGSGFLAALVAIRRSGHPAALLDSRSTAAELVETAASLGLSGVLRVRKAWPDGPLDFSMAPCRTGVAASIAHGMPPGTAVIKMTSGSGGHPRGVACTSDALLADDAALRAAMAIECDDRLIAMVPFAHSYGLSSLVVPALTHGMTLVVPAATGPFAPIAAAARCAATILPTVPAWLSAWLRLADPPPLPSSVRLTITAGAPLPPQTAHEFRRRFGGGLHVFYGSSESGGITYDRSGEAGERGTVGEPVPGVRVELQRIESHEPGAGGRVVVQSQAVALSYVPGSDGSLHGGRFVSQDLARWRGAELEIMGRLDSMINVRGLKVNPVEVERVIAEIPGVDGVFVHELNRSTSRDGVLNALVASTDRGLTPEAVLERCRARLSDYKIPRRIVLVQALPLTPRGKIDRLAVARLYGSPSSSDA